MFTIKCGREHFSDEVKSAIKRNDKRIISMLIEGINLAEIRDHEGWTLLHLAIKYNYDNCQIIKFLIDNGCDINAQDETGTTPIIAALKMCDYSIIRTLLEAKVNVFLSDNEGINALNSVIINNQINKRILIQLFAKHLKACELNANELAPLLIKAGWPIHYAIYIENSELLKLMIEAGCPINSRDAETDNYTALHTAVYNADIKSTKILLQYGADVDIFHENRESPFDLVTTIGSYTKANIFETFLECPSLLQRFNIHGMIKCYASFSYADAQIIELLAKYKINLTTKDRSGSTLLHFLVLNRNQEAINLISKAKVDINIKDSHGNTPLHRAIGSSYTECLIALIVKGADVNAKNGNGHTPLINAIRSCQEEEIDILIENGTILDEKSQNLILNEIISRCTPTPTIRPILRQIAIMHLHGEAVSTRNMSLIRKKLSIDILFDIYLQELSYMKQEQITVNSNISVFDILCRPKYQLVDCARNEEIVQNLFQMDICSTYPNFGDLVLRRFQVAHNQQILIQNAVSLLSKNIKQLNCNLEIITNIIKFLSQNDLVTLFGK